MLEYFRGDKMSTIFADISEVQKNKLFKLLEAHIYQFSDNEEILQTIKGINIICIILEGSANMIEINYNGDENLIEELETESVFGTAISDMNDKECQIRSTSVNTKIVVFEYHKLIDFQNSNHHYYNLFLNHLFDIIHTKLRERNDRIRIITKKTIRDKLLAYFEYEYLKTRSKFIYMQNNFAKLADYLAINRSAMFRELKLLKEDKFIKVEGKRITLLYTP